MDDMPGRFPPPPEGGPPQGYAPQPTGQFPMDLNRIFEMTFSLFRFGWRTFLAIALLVMIPVSLILAVSSVYTTSATTEWLIRFQRLTEDGVIDMGGFPWGVVGVGLLIGVVVGIGSWIAQAAVTHAAIQAYGGAPLHAQGSVHFALTRLGSIVAAYLITFLVVAAVLFVGGFVATLLFLTTSGGGQIGGIGVFLGLIIFVASFAALIFLAVRWALVVAVIVAEGGGGAKALGRSWRLVAGSSWRVLGYLLAFGLIFGVIAVLITTLITLAIDPASLSPESATRPIDPVRLLLINFLGGIVSALLLPFPAIGMTLLYLDLRWRRGEPVPQPGQTVPSPPVF